MAGRFVEALSERVLVFDGAMGTALHGRDLDIARDYDGCENCTDIVTVTRPDVVRSIHESFLAAGADVVETNTFGANPLVLSEFGRGDEAFRINLEAGRIARAAVEAFSRGGPARFVAGSMGPGTRLVTLGQTDWAMLLASYTEQARGLIESGVDVLLVETCQDLLQAKCAVVACLDALKGRDIPVMVSITIETMGTMLVGSSIEAAAQALAPFPILSLGVNCATGPAEMVEAVAWLGRHWAAKGRYISVMPNAGLPELKDGRAAYRLSPRAFADAMAVFVRDHGVRMVGGCCGTTPEHIRLLSEAVAPMRARPAAVASSPQARGLASLFSEVEYRQDTSFLIVGERMNASGSRAFKRLLEVEDWDGIVALAREQVRGDGAHVLDLNVDYAGRDNAADMRAIVARVARQVDAPLMLDSTQVATVEAGLRLAPGKCVINSANFEDGEEKFDALCGLAKRYGAALVVGSIDEDREASMARTAERKLAIAKRARERAVGVHGLDPRDLFFDPLVLPVSTGLESDRRSALETIEGVRAIARELPESQTIVGLSNVSFGLKPAARVVLNSAFLHELLGAGLACAIVHASKILPRDRIGGAEWDAAMDLVYDRREGGRDPLAEFIDLFREERAAPSVAAETRSLEERLRGHIVDGRKEGLGACLEEALGKYSALAIINDHLLDGMKTVGELFGSGRMQLPFVLQSAEVMKAAVAHLEPRMERRGGAMEKGTIVLATVRGDVHDIGKNLVDIILTNNGYKVVNLGIKQPLEAMVRAWREHGAQAIGMSGLLVKSVQVMEENLRELGEQGLSPRVLLGGAALTRHYAEGHLRRVYAGEVLYAKDAFEGLRLMEHIVAGKTGALSKEIEERLAKRSAAEETIVRSRVERSRRSACVPASVGEGERGEGVEPMERVPRPPFWGSRVVEGVDLEEVFPYINEVALFRGQWQVRKGPMGEEEYRSFLGERIRPVFERLKAGAGRVLRPGVVYGYFPCRSRGNDLIVYDPAGGERSTREVLRFTFPRQEGGRGLCISDFFRREGEGEHDTLAMQCVTVGPRATEEARKLFDGGEYAEYLYLHGFSVEMAEALAEFWHKRVREELGIAGEDSPEVRELFTQHYRGSRYSFGYPACPELSDQEKLWKLLEPERIGCRLTENWQIDPEQSTSAIIVHHPAARYFNV